METHEFFLFLLIILLTARLFAELATRLMAPAEIGIILLLFEVGLGTDVKRLVRTGLKSFVMAVAGFILPLTMGFALGYLVFEQSLLVSLFIGGTLTATSIGITVRVLRDLNQQHSPEGQIVLGATAVCHEVVLSTLCRPGGMKTFCKTYTD